MTPTLSRAKRFPWLALILAAYLLLATTYGVVTPVFEAPDEPQHFLFAKYLADGHGLPVQGEAGKASWAQEGSQPPLYYALCALLISPLDTANVDELLWVNPHVNMGAPLAEGNKNVYIHTTAESFPYHGAALAVHLLRLFSTLLGLGTILATYQIMRLAFPAAPWAALLAAGINALAPQFIFISAAVNNDNLVTMLSSWAIWAMLRLWTRPLNWRMGLGIGALIGAATLAKLSGLGLAALLAVTLALLWWRGRDWRKLLAIGAAACLAVLAIAGWWFARNMRLYGDLTGLSAMLDVFGWRQVTPGLQALLGEAEGLRISYWAIFGWFNILSWPVLYRIMDLISLTALAGLVYWAIHQRGQWDERQWAWLIMSVAWLVLMLASLIGWTRMTSGTQGRLLFPAIAAISGLIAIGLGKWLPGRQRGWLAAGASGALLVWSAICPVAYIAPAYARPPILAAEEIPADAQPIHIIYGGQFELLAYALDRASVAPGETLHVTAYWRCIEATDSNYSIYVHLYGQGDQPIGQADTYPGLGAYPTSLWQPGQVIKDTYPVTILDEALTPVLARIEIGPYLLDHSSPRLAMADAQGRPLQSAVVGRVRIASPYPPALDIPNPVAVAFGEQIELIGYELGQEQACPGGSIAVTLYWRALRTPDASYTVFAHLADDANTLAGQHDGQPMNGEYPTSSWQAGDVVKDGFYIPIKPDAKAGSYRLLVGLYQLETGVRLPTDTGADASELGSITISW